MTASETHITHSEEDTATLARELASELRAGDVLLLSGTLGAGKTAFVRGLAAGLGIDSEEVSSPTFTLVHEYRGGRLTPICIVWKRRRPRSSASRRWASPMACWRLNGRTV